MQAATGRLDLGVDPAVFMDTAIQARALSVLLPIVPQITVLAQAETETFTHGDPADRIIVRGWSPRTNGCTA